jgi:hypothetical protein
MRNLTVCACALVGVLLLCSDASAFGGKRRGGCSSGCGGVAYCHAPVSYCHAPVSYCHAPVSYCHAPALVYVPPPAPVCHAPVYSCGTGKWCGKRGGGLFGGRGRCGGCCH